MLAASPLHAPPRARSRVRSAPRCAAAAPQRSSHAAPGGVKLEVLRMAPTAPTTRPPLLFVHGSFHAAWCWAEHWMPFFSSRGYDTHAISLRGQGGSEGPLDGGGVGGTLETHAADVASYAAAIGKPVLCGHSFGGLVVQQAVSSRAPTRPAVAGVALLCSVPPAGNGPMVGRMLRATPFQAMRVTYAFISKAFEKDAQLCRDTFFSKALPEADVQRYMAKLAANGAVRLLDLRALNASLPVPPQPAGDAAPVLVLGAADDAVVDQEGVRETGIACGAVRTVLLPDLAHDIMLDAGWERAADALAQWLDTLPAAA